MQQKQKYQGLNTPQNNFEKTFSWHGNKKYTEMRMLNVLNHKVLIPNSLRKRNYNPTQRVVAV